MYSIINKNCFHAFFYGVLLLGVILLTGCSSTKTISRTYKEYIPSIEPAQQQCIFDYQNHRNDCQISENNTTQGCKHAARLAAQDSYNQALNDYQGKIGNIKAQQATEEKQRKDRQAQKQGEYDTCVSNEKIRKEKIGTEKMGYSSFHTICTPPRLDNTYSSNQFSSNNFYGREPREEDFINDAHCYTGSECEGSYDAKFVECGGKILFTTWCFANCVGEN